MKKTHLFLIAITSILFLSACSSNNATEKKAEKEDLVGHLYAPHKNTETTYVFSAAGGLMISKAPNITPNSKPEDIENDELVKEYPKVTITTKDDAYSVKADGLSLTFKKLADKHIVDSDGGEYLGN